MRTFWHDFFGLNDVHIPKGPLLSEQVRAFGEMDFPDIKPLDLPPIKQLKDPAVVVKAKRAKREKVLKPVLQMRRKA